ncbi:MAG: hypothetical protein R6U64_11005 [Bacteroidales bacterium]
MMKMKNQYSAAIIMLLLIITAACGGPASRNDTTESETATREESRVYRAGLNSLNQEITEQPVSGSLTITVQGDSATIELSISSIAPDMMHLAHLHGYEDGSEASCPGGVQADANGDGIVDLIETRDYSGITMIPFHDNPVSMEIQTDTYPQADAQGNLYYSAVVSVRELSSALQEKHGVQDFDFGKFVVYVHGVSEQTTLPETVQSLPGVPASVTLPVACGELN